jgi:hypothetical protein
MGQGNPRASKKRWKQLKKESSQESALSGHAQKTDES